MSMLLDHRRRFSCIYRRGSSSRVYLIRDQNSTSFNDFAVSCHGFLSGKFRLSTHHRRLRPGWGNGSTIGTSRAPIDAHRCCPCNYRSSWFLTGYTYYGLLLACLPTATVAFWHIDESFQAHVLADGFFCTSPSTRMARSWGRSFFSARKQALIIGRQECFSRHFCTTHTLLEVLRSLRAVLIGVRKEIPRAFRPILRKSF